MVDQAQRLKEIKKRIEFLHVLSRKGLWGLLLFLLISMLAAMGRQINIMAMLSEDIQNLLGTPPSGDMISVALAVYSFSALILVMGRLLNGSESYSGWSHIAYLSVFYVFYFFANALSGNFWAVFSAGMTLLGLEYYHIRATCLNAIREEKERLLQFEKHASS